MCLVGSGGIASSHAAALSNRPELRRRCVVSRRASAAARFQDEWGFETSGVELEQALGDADVDVVIVTSPSEVHAEQTVLALEAGKHVIVEIPAALGLGDCMRVRDVATRASRRVFVCHTMRSFPAIRALRRGVSDGSLDISQVLGFFAIPRRSNEGWTGTRSWIDNLLWHHACHQVDATLWVLGAQTGLGVTARSGRVHPEFGMAMDISLAFRTPSDQLVTQALSYNVDQLVWELRFVTGDGLLTFRDGGLFDQAGRVIEPPVPVRDVSSQNDTIFAALESGSACEFDLEEIVPTMQLLDLAQHSIDGAE